jgi:putative hydrolase of the HAD superfamily
MIVVFDLDDTLYDEVDFVASGFRAVAEYLDASDPQPLLDFMQATFAEQGSGKIFDALVGRFGLDVAVAELVEVYRFHSPEIELPADRLAVVEQLASEHTLALVSDGPWVMQRNKFVRLGLPRFIDAPVFTARLRAPKPSPLAFESLMRRFGAQPRYVYIGDNASKDFIAPRALGWHTIHFRNPRGVHLAKAGEADVAIADFGELRSVLTQRGG